MAHKKRGRELEPADWELDDALQQLQGTLERGTLERGTDQKLRALDKVISLVDPSDEQYCTQRALVAGDAAFYITELLADPAATVRAAEAVAALTQHSAEAQARLGAGALVGLDSRVERVSLNPCQSDFTDSGCVSTLVPMLFSRQEAAQGAASEAVAALCSYHQEGKLAYLEGLVQEVLQRQRGAGASGSSGGGQQGAAEVFELLDTLIDGMECGGDAAGQQLELLTQPLLQELLRGAATGRPGLRAGSSHGSHPGQEASAAAAALGLLGTLCEKRPDAAAELRREGAVASVAQHLLRGSQVVQDVAARALWALAKDHRRCLAAGEECQLACEPVALAGVLAQLIEDADAEEARAREAFGAADSGAEDEDERQRQEQEQQQGGAPPGSAAAAAVPPRESPPTPTVADICHAVEASQLLSALSGFYPEVKRLVEERAVPAVRSGPQCCIS